MFATLINLFKHYRYCPGLLGKTSTLSDSKTADEVGWEALCGEKGETATCGENATVGHRKNFEVLVEIACDGRSYMGDTGHALKDDPSHASGCPKSSSTVLDGEKHSFEGTEEVTADKLFHTD